MKKYIGLSSLVLITPIFVFACNKDNTNIALSSDTLTLSNYSYKLNQEFKTKLVLTNPTTTSLPLTLENKIKVGDNYLKEPEEQYTYNLETGELYIPKEFTTGKLTITVEARNNKESAYEANLNVDSHIKVYIYKTEDYTATPYTANKAYSRDKNTGLFLKNGTGEINLKVVPDDGYDIDIFWVKGLYEDVVDKSDTNKDIYTISNIRSDLDITITSKKIYCKSFASNDDITNKSIDFSWNYRNSENVSKTDITVSSAGSVIGTYTTTELSYTVNDLNYDTKYDFSFIPTLTDGTVGSTFTCTRYLLNPSTSLGIPYFKINTENNVFPTKKNLAKSGGGTTTVNKDNVKTDITFISEDGTTLYTSPSSLSDKIKIRGNSSSYYFTKQPYKLKLKNDTDLLSTYRETSEVNNTHKEWVLLPSSNDRETWKESTKILNTGVGNALCKLLDFEYKPEYKFVGVYINNDYQGLYLLAEQVARGNGEGDKQGRYKVDEDGFIIESDLFAWAEDLSFKTSVITSDKAYTFKYPSTDDFNEDDLCYKYIYSYVSKFEEYLKQKSSVCFDYFDIDSLAKWLMLHEIIKSTDYWGSNIYVTKKNMSDDSKLIMGTPWDFDAALSGDPTGEAPIKSNNCFYFNRLQKFSEFNTKLKEQYSLYKNSIKTTVSNYLSSLDDNIYTNLINIEANRWNTEVNTIQDQKDNITSFIDNRLVYLDTIYG